MNTIEELDVIIEKLSQIMHKQEEARAMAVRAMLLLRLQRWFLAEGKGNTISTVCVIQSPTGFIPRYPGLSNRSVPGLAVGYAPYKEDGKTPDMDKFVPFNPAIRG